VEWLLDRGVPLVELFEFEGGDPPPEPPLPPAPPPTQEPFVETGIVVSWHTIGDQGQSDVFRNLALLDAAPPSVKFVQDLGGAPLVKSYAPDTKIIGRMIDVEYNGQRYNVEGFDYNGDPYTQAEVRMELLRETMAANPDVDYWEIVNEILPPQPADIVTICEFFGQAMVIAEAWGKKLALFSFSMGTPEPESWEFAFNDSLVFECADDGGHAISLHEYGVWPNDAGSTLLRFEALYDWIGHLRIPLYITEYGVPREVFYTVDKMQQIREYDAQLAKLRYVAGAHVYVNPWDDDYSKYVDLYPEYEQYAIAVKDRVNG